jgi:transglutaminase-like putative cysteine protease
VYVGNSRNQRLGDYTAAPRAESPSAPTQPARVTLAGIPSGAQGTIATLKIMRGFVRDAVRNPDQTVRGRATALVSGLPARNWHAEIRALHSFVRDQMRYLRDPVDVELVQTPERSLEIMQGDCDDKATLLAALLDSIGHPARFVALGFNGEGFSHVLVETRIAHTGNDKRDWMPLETIIPREAGWFPEGVTSLYRLNI